MPVNRYPVAGLAPAGAMIRQHTVPVEARLAMAVVLRALWIPMVAWLLLACSHGQEQAPASAPTSGAARVLEKPLPGNIMPGFPYHLTADIELDAGMIKRRRLLLDLPGQELASAMRHLLRQWQEAGLDGTGLHQADGRLTAELWLPGDNGARGLMAPSYGGVYVLMVGVSGAGAEPPQLQITIHSP